MALFCRCRRSINITGLALLQWVQSHRWLSIVIYTRTGPKKNSRDDLLGMLPLEPLRLQAKA